MTATADEPDVDASLRQLAASRVRDGRFTEGTVHELFAAVQDADERSVGSCRTPHPRHRPDS